MSLRERMEAGFILWGRFVVRRRWWVIAACLALSGVLVSRLPDFRVDNSDASFLHPEDPARMRYDRFKDRFDREDRVMVALHPPEVFDLAFLEWLRDLHAEIEREVPYVEEVTSLVNARNTRGEGDELIVEDLMEEWPTGPEEVATLRRRVLANPLYRNFLISEDARHTMISVKPFTYSTLGPEGDELGGFDEGDGEPGETPAYLTDVEGSALVAALEEILARRAGSGVEMHMVGGPSFDHRMNQMLQRDVTVLMTASILVEIVILSLLFRRVSGVVLPLLVVLTAMLSTMGFMVWMDIPFSVTLNMLPAFLMVVGVCDAIHILAIFYRRLGAGETQEEAIVQALGHSGLAVVMTSVTTAAGLVSFRLAELAPIAQLGLLAPTGVMLAMLYSLALLPALLVVLHPDPAAGRRGAEIRGRTDRLLTRVGDAATRHPLRIVGVTLALLLLALPGFLRLGFSHDGMLWFPAHDPLRIALDVVDREFRGASSLQIVVDTGRDNGLTEPDVLGRIERLMEHARTLQVDGRPVSRANSIVDVVRETHQALNENRPEYYRLPRSRELIAQELLLFENSGSDDLEELTDPQLRTARVALRTPWVDAMIFPAFLRELEADLPSILGDGIDFELTGQSVLFSHVFVGVIHSMARSYVFALVVITPLMILLIGSLRRGLIAMLPNLIPVYVVLGFMGWTGIPLDAGTLLIGAVIIGLAVDDTIHFMHKFGRYYEQWGDARTAVHETLATTGSALLFTSLVLACGNLVFLFAYMRNTFWFGVLVFVGVVIAFFADILLAPALMVLTTRRRRAPRTG